MLFYYGIILIDLSAVYTFLYHSAQLWKRIYYFYRELLQILKVFITLPSGALSVAVIIHKGTQIHILIKFNLVPLFVQVFVLIVISLHLSLLNHALCPMLKIGRRKMYVFNTHLDVCRCGCVWGRLWLLVVNLCSCIVRRYRN